MITKEQIINLAEQHFNGTDRFVTKVNVSVGNKIEVLIDGDTPVTIDDCVGLSRFIEKNLNRDEEDFSLDVSSHGAASPLLFKRQYNKHIGRNFTVTLIDDTLTEGELESVNDNELTLKFVSRENKPIGKGKINIEKRVQIPFNKIKESKIKLKF